MEEVLLRKVRQLARRMRLLRAEQFAVRAALYGFAASLLLILADKLFLLPLEDPGFGVLALSAGSLLGGLAYGLVKRVSLLEAAIKADLNLNLKERLSASVEYLRLGEKNEMIKALIRDAAERSRAVEPGKAFPHVPPREARYLAGIIAGMVLLFAIPGEDFLSREPEQGVVIDIEELETIREEGEKLEELGLELQKEAEEEGLKETAEIAEEMQNLSQRLKGNLTKEEALGEIARLSEEVEKRRKNLGLNEDVLAEAAGYLEKAELSREAAEALKAGNYSAAGQKIRNLAPGIEAGNYTQEQLMALAEQLGNAGSVLLQGGSASTGSKMLAASSALSGMNRTAASRATTAAGEALAAMEKITADAKALGRAQTQLSLSRRAIAAAGQGQGQGQGEGQGGSGGGVAGAGVGAGPEAGMGSTNREGGSSEVQPQPYIDRLSLRTSGEGGEYERIYAPERVEVEGGEVGIAGEPGEGEPGIAGVRGAPSEAGAFVPYVDAYRYYGRVAEEALYREDIPFGYKALIKDYFEALQPEAQG